MPDVSDECKDKLKDIEDKLLDIYRKERKKALSSHRPFDVQDSLNIVRRAKKDADADCDEILDEIENKLLSIIEKSPQEQRLVYTQIFNLLRESQSSSTEESPPSVEEPPPAARL
jgi:exonuclease VII small subunit